MPTWQRIYLAACTGVIGWALTYALCDYAGWPRLAYDPVPGRFRMATPPLHTGEMGYWGLVAWAVCAALVAGGAVFLVTRFRARPVADRLLGLAGAWALTAAGLAGLFHTWNLWPFR